MSNQFASGKKAIAECDRCGQQYLLKELRTETIKQEPYKIRVCSECWDPDQPQLMLGTTPVSDPQALRDPRPDTSYRTSGINTLGYPDMGSRDIQWGWSPVGMSMGFDAALTPNYLAVQDSVGTVTLTSEVIPAFCSAYGHTAIPGYAIPGCSIPHVTIPF